MSEAHKNEQMKSSMRGSMLDPAANPDVDLGKRRFLIGATAVTGGALAAGVVFGLADSWNPSASTRAAGSAIEVDVSKLEPGGKIDGFFWRKQPIGVIYRTPKMIERTEAEETLKQLADPNSEVASQQQAYAVNPLRSLTPQHFVYISVCTHLGCSPEYRREVQPGFMTSGGFYCPCHGSKFDLAGRVYSGVPAPTNLAVPPYRYKETENAADKFNVLIIGEDPSAEELAAIQAEAS